MVAFIMTIDVRTNDTNTQTCWHIKLLDGWLDAPKIANRQTSVELKGSYICTIHAP